MELRQLEVFVAVATELHFGRAAGKLHIGQSTLSDLIQRLEREMGTPLLIRTTRRVALSSAGSELLNRAKAILDDVASATAAVQRMADGDAGTVRVGITPPVSQVLAPRLAAALAADAPNVALVIQRMWLSDLTRAIAENTVDVAITCGLVPDPPGVMGKVFCGEPLQVCVRPNHRFANRKEMALSELKDETLGIHSEALFPAWTRAQRHALNTAGVSPRMVELADTDLAASHWLMQKEITCVLTTGSVATVIATAPTLAITPTVIVPYTLQWNPDRARNSAVERFVHTALTTDMPTGWVAQSGLRGR